MKKITACVLLALLMLASCSTTVGVRYTRPSEVDLSGYESIAIAPARPYQGLRIDETWVRYVREAIPPSVKPGFSPDELSRDIARYAGEQVTGLLQASGWYDVLPPSETEGLTLDDLGAKGYKALIVPEVSFMDLRGKVRNIGRLEVEESGGVRSSKTVYESYLLETAEIELTLTVIDTATGEEIASRRFRDSVTKEFYVDPVYPEFDSMEIYFRRMVRGFNPGIGRMLVPESLVYEAKVMKNKPKLEKAEAAYGALSDGDEITALALFQECWNEEGHVPSGYNAALLLAGLGDIDSALSLLEGMLDLSEEASGLYQDLSALY